MANKNIILWWHKTPDLDPHQNLINPVAKSDLSTRFQTCWGKSVTFWSIFQTDRQTHDNITPAWSHCWRQRCNYIHALQNDGVKCKLDVNTKWSVVKSSICRLCGNIWACVSTEYITLYMSVYDTNMSLLLFSGWRTKSAAEPSGGLPDKRLILLFGLMIY